MAQLLHSGSPTALLVIDMQRGFFEDPALAAQQSSLVKATNDLLRLAAQRDAPVFNVVTEHDVNRSTWTLSMLDDDQGFNFVGTAQAESLPGLDWSRCRATKVSKIRDSAFHGTDLAQRLRLVGVVRLLLCGVEAQNCVALTGRGAFDHDFRAAFALDAIGSRRPERGRQALADNQQEVRQPLLRHDQLAQWWD